MVKLTINFTNNSCQIQMKYSYTGPFYLHFEDNLTHERRIIEDEESYVRALSEAITQSSKTGTEVCMRLIFQPPMPSPFSNYPPYSNRNYPINPIPNCKIRK